MSSKYGPIICDPKSEEAKALVGKSVVYGWNYTELKNNPKAYTPGTLLYIKESCTPFVCSDGECYFIREVIEEEPKYRPYNDCDEMVSDYCERFGVVKTNFGMPMIWVNEKRFVSKKLILEYNGSSISFDRATVSIVDLLQHYTYLDGSPVGKMITQCQV